MTISTNIDVNQPLDKNYEIIRKSYLEILEREPDDIALNHFLILMEKDEVDENKLREMLQKSEEHKILLWRKNNTTKKHPCGNFFIKENYLHRLKPAYLHKTVNGNESIIWQPYVYQLGRYIGKKLGCTHIVDLGCGSAQKLVSLFPEFEITGIDYGDNIIKCRNYYQFGNWIEWDFEKPDYLQLPKQILENSVLICSDVIEHLMNPTHLLNNLKRFLDYSPACLLTTPERDLTHGKNNFGPPLNPHHVREWNLPELEKLLFHYNFNLSFIGLTVSNNRDNEKKTSIVGIQNNNSSHDLFQITKWNESFLNNFMVCHI